MCVEWTKKIIALVACLFVLCNQPLSAESVSSTPSSYPALTVKQAVISLLGMSEDSNKVDIQAGEELWCSLEITNSGTAPANDVLLLTHLPVGLTYVPNSVVMNGDLPIPPFCAVTHQRTLAFHGVTIPPQTDQPTLINFRVKVNRSLPPRLARLNTMTQAVYLGDPVLAEGTSGDESIAKSDPVVLTVKKWTADPEPTSFPYALLDATEKVILKDGKTTDKRAYVCPGDTVTFVITITNKGDKASDTTIWQTFIPKGMTYVANSVRINDVLSDATLSNAMLFGNVSIGAKGESNNPIKLSFQAQVDASVPEDVTRFSNYNMFTYFGNPDFAGSVAASNSVLLFLRK